jgi:hypothetical protein
MPEKLNYDFIKNVIESKGFKLLSDTYEGVRHPLYVSCKNGHYQYVTYDNMKNENICKICQKNERIEGFLNLVIERKHVLLEEYNGSKKKILLQCERGHKFMIRPNDFQQGVGCMKCRNEFISKIKTKNYDDVKEFIEKEGYQLIEKEYTSCFKKLRMKCNNGHEFMMKFSNFKNSHQRCPKCYILGRPFTYDYVKEYIESFGYKLLSNEYKNCKTKLNIECDKNHKYFVSYNSFQQGERCPICSKVKFFSKGEKELLSAVEENYPGAVVPNDRTQIINPKTGHYLELDIWLPELKKGIEYNGTYWHRDVQRDKLKQNLCKRRGIKLLVIDELSWMQNKSNCINRVLSFIGE